MFDYKVIFTGQKVFKAESLDHAEEIAEKYLQNMANPLNLQIFSVSDSNKEEIL